MLKDELYVDRLSGFSFRTKYDLLKKEVTEIESQIRQLNEGLDSLGRLLQRSVLSRSLSRFFGCPCFAFLRGNSVQESLISSAIFSFLILFRYVFHFYENILYLFTLFRTCVSFEGFFLVSLDLTESILSGHFFRILCGLVLVIIYGFFNTKRILL